MRRLPSKLHSLRHLARLLCLVLALLHGIEAYQHGRRQERVLMGDDPVLDERHNENPNPHPADTAYTISKLSHLMQSVCRPEPSGFFGSTSGTPAVFQYGFQLESTASADLESVLDTVGEHVMDTVLSQTFPTICGINRRLALTYVNLDAHQKGRITGFKFAEGQESVENSMTCHPQVNASNTCAYYKSAVKVFGINMDWNLVETALRVSRDAVPDSLSEASKAGAVRLTVSEVLTKIVNGPQGDAVGGYNSGGGGGAKTDAASKVALAASILVLLAGMISLAIYCQFDYRARRRRRQRRRDRSRSFRKSLDGDNETCSVTHVSGMDSDATRTIYTTVSTAEETTVTNLNSNQNAQGGTSLRERPPKSSLRSSTSRRQPFNEQQVDPEGDRTRHPVVLEFGSSFDPDLDRFKSDQAPAEQTSVAPEVIVQEDAPEQDFRVTDMASIT